MSNPNIVQAGLATRFKPGQSANPGGRRRTSLTAKLRDWLAKDSELFEAVRVIEEAEGPDAVEKYDIESLSNADLVVAAITGIALNRTGGIAHETRLKALTYLWDRNDGRLTDKPTVSDDESTRPLMSVEDFRRAITMPAPAPATVETSPVVIDTPELAQD